MRASQPLWTCGSGVHSWLAALGLLLTLGASPRAAQADPAAYCGPTGDVSIEQGQGLPLPNRYENPTDLVVSFYVIIQNANIFNFPNPLYGPLILNPHENRSIPDLAFPTSDATPTGSDTLILDVFGTATSGTVTTNWGPFRCTYQLTVLPPIRDLIVVPVRWCAVEGSPQAHGRPGPKNNGGAFTTTYAQRLLIALQQISDQIYLPQSDTHILFRSVSGPQGIPVIDDPVDDGSCVLCRTTPGAFDPDQNLETALLQCRQAWDQLYPGLRGTLLVNATAFPYRISGETPGFSDFTLHADIQPLLCNFPAALDIPYLLSIQGSAVFDPDEEGILVIDKHVKTLGHELGHSLALGHGDGLDNNMDGSPAGTPPPSKRLYDALCDPLGVDANDFPIEDKGTTAHSLMDYSDSLFLSPLQRETLRYIAKLVPGSSFSGVNDPAGSLVSPPRACAPKCGLPDDLFVVEAGMAETPPLAATTFWHAVRGPLPAGAADDYLMFVDLDGNAATGCDPASLFPRFQGFSGAELVSRVTVSNSGGKLQATPTAWRCQGGSLVQIQDAAVKATVLTSVHKDAPKPSSPSPHAMRVSLRLPDALRGPAANQVRLQAIALGAGGQADLLPATGNGGSVSLTPPPLPECTLVRPLLAPGQGTTVRASHLSPNQPADLLVGDQVVATGATNAAGDLAIDFNLPAHSRQGLRPVLVLLRGGAENAFCSLRVEGKPVTPATSSQIIPSPDGAGWSNTDVTVSLAAADRPGGPGLQNLTYSATGAQPLPLTKVAGGTASIALANEGETDLSFFATNQDAVTEAPQALAVRIDKTRPTVTYSGNAGSYAITANVNITCHAADALSGVAYTTCQDIKGPARTFAVGTNSYSAVAVDFAGNKGAGTTTFTVKPTLDNLCTLTQRFLAPPDRPDATGSLAKVLCGKLKEARDSQAAGRMEKSKQPLDDYIRALRETAPQRLDPSLADLLIRLASACTKAPC
jgi:hypothetical protein